jgi:formylglycine-generating enzyme required for sulfatase activity
MGGKLNRAQFAMMIRLSCEASGSDCIMNKRIGILYYFWFVAILSTPSLFAQDLGPADECSAICKELLEQPQSERKKPTCQLFSTEKVMKGKKLVAQNLVNVSCKNEFDEWNQWISIKKFVDSTKDPKKCEEMCKWNAYFVLIEGGCYTMGCVSGDGGCDNDEKPPHRVCVDDFYTGKTEVTVGQFRACVNDGGCAKDNFLTKDDGLYCNYGNPDRENHPMNCVSWNGAKEFTTWLSRITGMKVRLPSEAEWEYAAKNQGKDVIYPWGSSKATCEYAVMNDGGSGCGKKRTWPVCSKPNGKTAQGLCDMAGNVYEWCQDWYEWGYYEKSPEKNPKGPESGSYYVVRGGGFGYEAEDMRASGRRGGVPVEGGIGIGFRCVHD